MDVMPSKSDVLVKLKQLCSGDLSRTAVANWATSIIRDKSAVRDRTTGVLDRRVWDVLIKLGAADLPSIDREFLYSVRDFEDWKAELGSDEA